MVHSHNDYAQKEPFWLAFKAGCSSLEADVILNDGQLMVAHNAEDSKAENTFEYLYLKPLLEIYESPEYIDFDLQILIDVKTKAESTLKVIVAELEKYSVLISGGNTKKKVNFVVSGNRPDPANYEDYPDFLSFDYQTVKDWPENMGKVALVSLPFYLYSHWKGIEVLPEKEAIKLKSLIDLIHSKNKKVRFWATPDTELAWQTMCELGMDYINTDHPTECFDYLKTYVVARQKK